MTDYPMERCSSCAVQLPADLAHHPHEPDCKDPDLCYCPVPAVCPLCCEECARPAVIPGQVSLLPEPPEASTKALPKWRTG